MQAMRTTACGSPMVVCAYSFAAIGSSILAQALGIWALGAFGPKGPGVYRMGGRGGGIYGGSIYIGGGMVALLRFYIPSPFPSCTSLGMHS